MKRFVLITILLLTVMTVAPASAYTLSGTIYDFCAPGVTGCTQLSDFEGNITGLVTGMVSPTLNASGLPDYIGGGSGATNATNFAKWYVNSPGYNQSISPFSLPLNETSPGSGLFTYQNFAFFPIDSEGYGTQGRSHNYHFTMHLEGLTSFTAADTFSFYGDDDLWVYIGGKLVMDLGGVHSGLSDTFTGADLIALGLTPGTLYDLDIFFAERHTTASNFEVTTSLRIVPTPEPMSMLLLGLGLVGLAGVSRRKF